MTKVQIQLAEKILGVMQAEGVTPAQLQDKVPYGFWPKVASATGRTSAVCNVTWNRDKATFLAYIAEHQGGIPAGPRVSKPMEPAKEHKVITPDTGDNIGTPDESTKTVTGDKGDTIGRREVEQMISSLESRLTRVITLTHEQRDQVGVAMPFTGENRPPKQEKIGPTNKRLPWTPRDLRTRIDSVVYSLLERDAEKFFGGNVSQCLTAVLWVYYGKPRLSYEQGTDEEV